MPNEAPLTSRERLLRTLEFDRVAPPRLESEFSDDVVKRWHEEGHFQGTPEAYFHLDSLEYLPLEWRLERKDRPIVKDHQGFRLFRGSFDSLGAHPAPEDWPRKRMAWKTRDYPLAAAPWREGFFQLLGIRNGATLTEALVLLKEQPSLAEAQMAFYADYVEHVLDEVLPGVDLDMAIYYEPIASNHGPVISPDTYRHFVQPALRRVVTCLERHGVRHHCVRSAGYVKPLIPVWLEAGINGFLLNRSAECGLHYPDLRKEFGTHIRLFGGIDWRTVMEGVPSIEHVLANTVRPLLEQGGYVPYLDDTVRGYMPFEAFQTYRQRLDALTGCCATGP
jgi:hypothetical protein